MDRSVDQTLPSASLSRLDFFPFFRRETTLFCNLREARSVFGYGDAGNGGGSGGSKGEGETCSVSVFGLYCSSGKKKGRSESRG